MKGRILTPRQVSERTGLALQTLANWRSKSQGPPTMKIGRLVRYPEDSLDVWLEEQTFKP